MQFLSISRFTKPVPLRLLDVAYVVVLLPLLFVIKAPMLIFMTVVFVLLLIRKRPTGLTLTLVALMGFFALFLTLYGSFNFAGLSRLKLFVELLISLLIVAVALQRMTRTINFYLLTSPVLLLAMSLFYFHSIIMLVYVIGEIFVLLWLILAYRMQGSFRQTLRMSATLFIFSLPWVVILFIFFPRISFEHATYGFKGEGNWRVGHDGTMYMDSKALSVPSERIVMEVGFKEKVPPSHQLYFRGTVLYKDKKTHWEPLQPKITGTHWQQIKKADDLIIYKVTLYPTNKRWIYLLDMPYETPKGTSIDADMVATDKRDIIDPLHYEAASALSYRYGKPGKRVLAASLNVSRSANPRSAKFANSLKKNFANLPQRTAMIEKLFRESNLTYSLAPKPLDLNHSTDSFLFDKRSGYCVHFASSFVTMARLAGIPARIVTGYKADPVNSVEKYLVVKERDAHAWAELYLDNQWVRYETTRYAARINTGEGVGVLQSLDVKDKDFWEQANLYLLYVKYQAQTWILEYSHFRQLQLLNFAKKDPVFVLKFVGVLLLIVIGSFLLSAYFRRPVCAIKALCILQPLLHKLASRGFARGDGETLHQFFTRYLATYPEEQIISAIDRQYEAIRYGDDRSKESIDQLQGIVHKFLSER